MNRNPTDIQGQDAEREETALKKAQRREQELEDIKQVMGSRQGRRLMWRLISQAGVYLRDSGNFDLATMAYEKGLRVVGQRLIEEIHAACPEQYEVMKREQRNATSR